MGSHPFCIIAVAWNAFFKVSSKGMQAVASVGGVYEQDDAAASEYRN